MARSFALIQESVGPYRLGTCLNSNNEIVHCIKDSNDMIILYDKISIADEELDTYLVILNQWNQFKLLDGST